VVLQIEFDQTSAEACGVEKDQAVRQATLGEVRLEPAGKLEHQNSAQSEEQAGEVEK